MKYIKISNMFIVIICFVIGFGCEKNNMLTVQTVDESNIVGILKMWVDENTNTDIQTEFVLPLQEKYPNLQIQTTTFTPPYWNNGKKLDDLIANEEVPDIIFADSILIPKLLRNNLLDDIDFLSVNMVDIDLFNSSIIKYLRSYTGDLIGLPYSSNAYALFYNKEIFDSMDVRYPTDNMTWSEVIELAEQIGNRAQGKYLPLDIVQPDLLVSQSTLRFVDSVGNKANFDTDDWRSLFSTMQRITGIPGNDKEIYYQDGTYYGGFTPFEMGHVAMAVGALEGVPGKVFSTTRLSRESFGLINWDIASFPVFSHGANGPATSFNLLGIHPDSKLKKEAFQAITWLVSKDKQEANAVKGRASARTDINMSILFGANHRVWKQKNRGALFAHPDAVPVGSIYEDDTLVLIVDNELSRLLSSKNANLNKVIENLAKSIDHNTKTINTTNK